MRLKFKIEIDITMKNIILIIISISSLVAYGQTEENLSKAQIKKMTKGLNKMESKLKSQKTNDFSSYFKPELIDTFFNYIKQDNFNELYNHSDELLKNIQSRDDIEKYFKAVKQFYGQINNYEQQTYSIGNQWMSDNKIATATYKTEFDKAKATVTLAFNIIDSKTIQLQTFQISLKDYTEIDEFDKISRTTLELLISQDYQKLYNSTSERFQTYTPIGKYEEFIKRLKDIDFSKYKQYKNQIGVIGSKTTLYIVYDINEGQGFLTLTFTEIDNTFQLEGLNYNPKK